MVSLFILSLTLFSAYANESVDKEYVLLKRALTNGDCHQAAELVEKLMTELDKRDELSSIKAEVDACIDNAPPQPQPGSAGGLTSLLGESSSELLTSSLMAIDDSFSFS